MDAIGPFTFIRLDRPPGRAQTQWEPVAKAGVAGVALWNTGSRGEEFTCVSEAVALNFLAGRAFYRNYLSLVDSPPVNVVYGTLEEDQRYKVLKVENLGVKSVPRAHVANDPTWYTALVMARWTLLPIDPAVQIP